VNLVDLMEVNRQGEGTISVEQYGQVVGVSRATAYQAVRLGHVRALRVAGRWRVLVRPLLVQLGVDIEDDSPLQEVTQGEVCSAGVDGEQDGEPPAMSRSSQNNNDTAHRLDQGIGGRTECHRVTAWATHRPGGP